MTKKKLLNKIHLDAMWKKLFFAGLAWSELSCLRLMLTNICEIFFILELILIEWPESYQNKNGEEDGAELYWKELPNHRTNLKFSWRPAEYNKGTDCFNAKRHLKRIPRWVAKCACWVGSSVGQLNVRLTWKC